MYYTNITGLVLYLSNPNLLFNWAQRVIGCRSRFTKLLLSWRAKCVFITVWCIHRIHSGGLKTSDRGWTGMSILMALIQNCRMANASSNSTAVVFTENDIPGATFEMRKPAKLRRRSLSSLDLVVCAPYYE